MKQLAVPKSAASSAIAVAAAATTLTEEKKKTKEHAGKTTAKTKRTRPPVKSVLPSSVAGAAGDGAAGAAATIAVTLRVCLHTEIPVAADWNDYDVVMLASPSETLKVGELSKLVAADFGRTNKTCVVASIRLYGLN